MTLLELKAYFESYATLDPDLKHDPLDKTKSAFFCVQTEQNITEFVRSCKMDLFMAMMPYDKSLNKTDGQNYIWNKHVGFLILKKYPVQIRQVLSMRKAFVSKLVMALSPAS